MRELGSRRGQGFFVNLKIARISAIVGGSVPPQEALWCLRDRANTGRICATFKEIKRARYIGY